MSPALRETLERLLRGVYRAGRACPARPGSGEAVAHEAREVGYGLQVLEARITEELAALPPQSEAAQ